MWGTQLLTQFWGSGPLIRWGARAVLLFARSSNPRVNRRRGAGGVPPPVLNYGKRAKTHTIQRRRLCTFSRSVSDAVDQSICIVCPFLLLHHVATCPVYQHASFWHILATPTLPYFCVDQTNLYPPLDFRFSSILSLHVVGPRPRTGACMSSR